MPYGHAVPEDGVSPEVGLSRAFFPGRSKTMPLPGRIYYNRGMNPSLQQAVLEKWKRYFGAAELPLGLFYTDDAVYAEFPPRASKLRGQDERCVISRLLAARDGETVVFSKETVGCQGGARYAGYSTAMGPKFKYFLSCGIPGVMKGERYKKTPEIVEQLNREAAPPPAPAAFLVFKRWDTIAAAEEPAAVVVFAEPDTLAGLFTLANFRGTDPFSVITPFSAGCGSIIAYPLLEAARPDPRGVIGMFDPSARPYVGRTALSFAAPWRKFLEMAEDMDESFLITPTWDRIRKRMGAL